jgi:hypothetical protein
MSVITRVIKFLRVGVGISNTDVEYAESESQTTAPTEGWQTTAPKWRKDYYIWSRTHIYYTDGNEKVSTPMCLSVARSIDRIEECYYSSTSSTAITGGAWAKGKSPTWVSGRYIWTKSIIYFTDGTSTETTPICCTGGQGPSGPQGKPGKDGADGDDGADGADGKDAINIQMSMPTIVHKKSQFAGTYAIDVRAYKAGVELACSVSVEVPTNYASSVKASVINNDKGKRVIVVIAANIDVNTNLALSVKVENVTYKYTIPVKTIADGEDGKRGEVGATLRGPQSWANCGNGYSFECGASGEEWKDVVFYKSGFYSCIKSHIKSANNYPGSDEDTNNGYWRLGSPIEMVLANIILTQYQLVDNLGVKVIEMRDEQNKIVFLAKDGDVICNKGTFDGIKVTGDSEFSGTMKAVSGSFKSLNCVDDKGKVVGNITFGSDGRMWFDGDMYSQGYRSDKKRSNRFYTSDVFCRGMFGHRGKTMAVVKGTYMYVYSKGTDQPGVYVSLKTGTTSNNKTFYYIPLYGPSNTDGLSGMPIDVVVFNTSSDYYYAFSGMGNGKEWRVINGNDRQTVHFCDIGGWHELVGGASVNCVYVNPEWLNPIPDKADIARGVFWTGEKDLNW